MDNPNADTDAGWQLHPSVSIRMTALDFALRWRASEQASPSEVVEAARVFEAFLVGNQ